MLRPGLVLSSHGYVEVGTQRLELTRLGIPEWVFDLDNEDSRWHEPTHPLRRYIEWLWEMGYLEEAMPA